MLRLDIDLTVTRNLNVGGITTLGNDVNADTVTFNSKINSNFLPNGNQDIGASNNKWKNVFAETVTADVTGNTGYRNITRKCSRF